MALLDRVDTRPQICRIEIAIEGETVPSVLAEWQSFYNATEDLSFTPAYIGLGSVSFAEDSEEVSAGTKYTQTVAFRFPATDRLRADRLLYLQKARYIKVRLSTGKNILLGRNDYYQNCAPKAVVKSNHHLAEITYTTTSMFPAGFGPDNLVFGFPYSVPTILMPI